MEASIVRELRDWEAWLLAVFAAAALFVPTHNVGTAILAAAGVLAIRVVAGITLHGTHLPPVWQYEGLTRSETLVAWYIFRGRIDPAISRRTGLSLRRVRDCEARIKRKWSVATREEIAAYVSQLAHEKKPYRRHWRDGIRPLLLEVITVFGLVGIGLTTVAVPEETPLIGDVRDPLGLMLTAAGLVTALIFVATYFLDRR